MLFVEDYQNVHHELNDVINHETSLSLCTRAGEAEDVTTQQEALSAAEQRGLEEEDVPQGVHEGDGQDRAGIG